MSNDLMTQVWKADLKRDQKSILVCLADLGNDDGEGIYPSQDYIAWKTGYSLTQVKAILKECKDAGYIRWQRGASHVGTNNYKIVAAAFPKRDPWKPQPKTGYRQKSDSRKPAIEQPESGYQIAENRLLSLSDPLVTPEMDAPVFESPTPDDCEADADLSSEKVLPENTKGDLSDNLVKNQGARDAMVNYLENSQEDALKGINLDGYPEDVAPVVRMFCRDWGHRPPRNKSEKAFWIEGAKDLKDACGEHGSLALKRVRELFEDHMGTHQGLAPFTVSSPASLVKATRSVAAQMRLDLQKREIRNYVRPN